MMSDFEATMMKTAQKFDDVAKLFIRLVIGLTLFCVFAMIVVSCATPTEHAPAPSFQIVPDNGTIREGSLFPATLRGVHGPVAWTSSNASIAAAEQPNDSMLLVRAFSPGEVVITGTQDGVSKTFTLWVYAVPCGGCADPIDTIANATRR